MVHFSPRIRHPPPPLETLATGLNLYPYVLQSDDVSKVSRSGKIVERMVNQNIFDDVAQGNYPL